MILVVCQREFSRARLVDVAEDAINAEKCEVAVAVEFLPAIVDMVAGALSSEQVRDPCTKSLAVIAGFRAYVSLIAGSDRRTVELSPWDEPKFFGYPLYFDPNLPDYTTHVVTRGWGALAEAHEREKQAVAAAGRR